MVMTKTKSDGASVVSSSPSVDGKSSAIGIEMKDDDHKDKKKDKTKIEMNIPEIILTKDLPHEFGTDLKSILDGIFGRLFETAPFVTEMQKGSTNSNKEPENQAYETEYRR